MTTLILVVDDEPSIRAVISEVLRSEEYQVVEAGHGLEALELLEQITPTGMLVDLTMPVMDGPTLLRTLRARGVTLPTLVVTAEHRADALLRGVSINGVIAKPFDLDHLLEMVAGTFGSPCPSDE